MSNRQFELGGSMSGLTVSPSVTIGADGPLHIIYEAHKCYSAWLEITPSGSTVPTKIPFIGRDIPDIYVSANSSVKVVGSVPPNGYLRVTLVY